MQLIRLERPVHYGNAGAAFNERQPPDDTYLFPPDNTADVWSHVRQITERYGYDFFTDEAGDFVLQTRNNPHAYRDFEVEDAAGATQQTHPSAYGGTYLQFSGTPSFTVAVNAARIDVVLPRGPSLGTWTVTIKQGGSPVVAPVVLDPSAGFSGGDPELYYYDFRATTDGINATVVTVFSGFFDTYDVEFTTSGAATRKLDCLQLWHTDPLLPLLPLPLSNASHAETVAVRPTADEQRNFVTVIGRRKAAVTDSEKIQTNPNNPDDEFVVSSAVDTGSIANPWLSDDTTPNPNFTGYPKESHIVDSKITDRDFAEYLSRTFIYRYRMPRSGASVRNTLLPVVQLRDPVYVVDDAYGSLDSTFVQFVQSVQHEFTESGAGLKATTQLDTIAYLEYPSYEVRQDIDIDQHFNGNPVINVDVAYTSLTDTDWVNPAAGLAHVSGAEDIVTTASKAVQAGNYLSMTGEPWPPLPGTVFLTPASASGSAATTTSAQVTVPKHGVIEVQLTRVLSLTQVRIERLLFPGGTRTTYILGTAKTGSPFYYEYDPITEVVRLFRTSEPIPSGTGFNITTERWTAAIDYQRRADGVGNAFQTNTPYHHLLEVDYANRRIDLPWKQADNVGTHARTHNTWAVSYRKLGPVDGSDNFDDPYNGDSPFYDPYTSELGYLVNVTFDALVSGQYRVSVRSCYDDTVVAWLTEPTADAEDPEVHWQYITAGVGRSFAWDGVDQVGAWNQRQSDNYAAAAHDVFEQGQRPAVGAGFYVWNREERIQNGYPLYALISGDVDGGKPVFGQGTFAEWYVKFEVKNDYLEERYDEALSNTAVPNRLRALEYPRIVDSRRMQDTAGGAVEEARVYTHLPQPTGVELEVADWVGWKKFGARFDPQNTGAIDTAANWAVGPTNQRTQNPSATINNREPVRFRFFVRPRPGVLWAGQDDQIAVKLFRNVHLRYNLFDQFVVFEGTNYPGENVENRRIVNRRMTNDDHTVVFSDGSWRLAKSFKNADGEEGTEWIFIPSDFQKDFRGYEEPLKFGDYLQLEEVPRWDSDRAVAGGRSRYQIGFINYLFYLSCYTQDRSGRYTWAIDPSFLDKAKITTNAAADWTDPTRPLAWPDDMNTQFRRTVITRQWTDEEVTIGTLWVESERQRWGFASGSIGHQLLKHKWKDHSPKSTTLNGVAWTSFGLHTDSYSETHRNWSATHADPNRLPTFHANCWNRQLGTTSVTMLNDWIWETGPTWVPSITRDFHGYYLLPPMVDRRVKDYWPTRYIYGQVDPRTKFEDDGANLGDDAAAQPVWNSVIRDMTEGTASERRFWVGTAVTPGKDPSKTVPAHMLDYQRQDELVHWEDCRGIFSRGPRPEEQTRKVPASTPYYQNVYEYDFMQIRNARNTQRFLPLYRAQVVDWFDVSFRSHYVWESSRLFPTTLYGKERTAAANADLARIISPSALATTRYDAGAWAGWKDDTSLTYLSFAIDDSYNTYQITSLFDGSAWEALEALNAADNTHNLFEARHMPLAVGPRLPDTVDAIFHMVLVNERRDAPI